MFLVFLKHFYLVSLGYEEIGGHGAGGMHFVYRYHFIWLRIGFFSLFCPQDTYLVRSAKTGLEYRASHFTWVTGQSVVYERE